MKDCTDEVFHIPFRTLDRRLDGARHLETFALKSAADLFHRASAHCLIAHDAVVRLVVAGFELGLDQP